MIYPEDFEDKISFGDIRSMLRSYCLSTLGKGLVDAMQFTNNADEINTLMRQTMELRHIREVHDDFPLHYFIDMRAAVLRIKVEGTHLEEKELFDLSRSLGTIGEIVKFFNKSDDGSTFAYPTLHRLTETVGVFLDINSIAERLLDKYGNIKDTASPHLASIRQELTRTTGSISHTLNKILREAQSEGYVDKDAAPTVRDGRLVIPVPPGMKRKIRGIVHDESASGKTVFMEPAEVVETNNRIRELEAEERREIIRILIDATNAIRPRISDIMTAYEFMAKVDFINAKAEFAKAIKATEIEVADKPLMDWSQAYHPLLRISLERQGKTAVPLDIELTQCRHILIISGPNAGGKSVCLKTVGLLQYMLQCGLSVPMSESSKLGVFNNIMIDIGDEQSIENDLSTYSSHLMNMKNMMKHSGNRTLLLIDEFGSGTEPQIGGALAEAILKKLCDKKAYGVITTHYQNLKHFADSHPGVANAAMLYDRNEMKALFRLSTGQPGSSFAIEMARKTGIPEDVINDASAIVGADYIQSDKYLQDIVRDKRYWENKRQIVHQREKELEKKIEHYESEINELRLSRKEILKKAKVQAEEILKQSNRKMENAIREIKECQAEKEETKRIREELNAFKDSLKDDDSEDELIAKKIKQIQERKQRKERRKAEKESREKAAAQKLRAVVSKEKGESVGSQSFAVGDIVKIKGTQTIGTIESCEGNNATIIFGGIRTKTSLSALEHAEKSAKEQQTNSITMSRETRKTFEEHKLSFRQDLDVRGMRGDEALTAVTYFIDDAILVGMPRVRILHGKGNGILRNLIRQYLASVPNVTHYADEHVQFGGAGITVVNF